MKRFVVILVLGLTSVASAKPAFLPVPLMYAASITPGTQIITNSGTPDSRPEVAVTGTRQAAARIDERANLAAARSPRRQQSLHDDAPRVSTSPAPLGVDGRVVDTPEVAVAKAAHAAAHANERLKLAREAARSGASDSSEIADRADVGATPEATIGPDGRILDTPEVAAARTAHEKINLANEIARTSDTLARLADGAVVPLVLGNGVVAALVPVGVDGRPLDAPEVAVHDNRNLNNVKSVDALAVAGPALAYGRLVY
ncbi:hypothetical protein X777_15843 [Ooceraea biroi]|uniref:Cuticle protein n=1 Tax=Ooceraea biroi TaxID=2015173 RepID=A0A026WU79_OOCBI|nr:hypothetical protein X777_15843 [Ooceraea biroi]